MLPPRQAAGAHKYQVWLLSPLGALNTSSRVLRQTRSGFSFANAKQAACVLTNLLRSFLS